MNLVNDYWLAKGLNAEPLGPGGSLVGTGSVGWESRCGETPPLETAPGFPYWLPACLKITFLSLVFWE